MFAGSGDRAGRSGIAPSACSLQRQRTMNLARRWSGVTAAFVAVSAAACAIGADDVGSSASNVKTTTPFDLNDVSVLWPLPKKVADRDQLVSPADVGNLGTLLPRSIFDTVYHPREIDFTEVIGRDEAYESATKVVAMRFDPCPPAALVMVPCHPMIRLVFQTLLPSEDHPKFGAIDAALHAIYVVPEKDVPVITSELAALKARSTAPTTKVPLEPHPALVKEGLGGNFGKAVRELILRHAGEKNLVGTGNVVVASASHSSWTFTGFNVANGEAVQRIPLPNIRIDAESDGDGRAQTFESTSDPPATGQQNLMPTFALFQKIESGEGKPTDAEVTTAIDLTFGVENPTKATLDNGDCVSCHRSTHHRAQIVSALKLGTVRSTRAFPAPPNLNLTNTEEVVSEASSTSKSVRNFGYFEDKTSISQRTINETAAVAMFLSKTPFDAEAATGFGCDFKALDACRKGGKSGCEKTHCSK
jgi:hypothetical protein